MCRSSGIINRPSDSLSIRTISLSGAWTDTLVKAVNHEVNDWNDLQHISTSISEKYGKFHYTSYIL